ncbi:MAG: peptide-methionine (S)-S-oxide reductase [Candidatus Azotimanducaceae bacterium]|jgi:peptide-methionine (S)-S-oxide reductase
MIKNVFAIFFVSLLAFSGMAELSSSASSSASSKTSSEASSEVSINKHDGAAVANRKVVLAGGCFWCMEPPFDKLDGVVSTVSGYAGGHLIAPTYRDVTGGRSGHLEVVQVTYDPVKVSYEELLKVFWENVDPLDGGGQFCDRGESYTTAVFTTSEREQKLAQASLESIQGNFQQQVKTQIRPLTAPGFYAAEDYHQDYYQKNPIRYKFYRTSCGRDSRLNQLWGG